MITLARNRRDVEHDIAVAERDDEMLGHYPDVPGAVACKARAQERLSHLRAEYMAANWSAEAAAELAVIHLSIYPEPLK